MREGGEALDGRREARTEHFDGNLLFLNLHRLVHQSAEKKELSKEGRKCFGKKECTRLTTWKVQLYSLA